MGSFDAILRHATREHGTLRKLCEPLNSHFNIDLFAYNFITPEGLFIGLCNVPDIADHKFAQMEETGSFDDVPFLKSASNAYPAAVMLEQHDGYKKHMMSDRDDRYTVAHPVALFRKDRSGGLHCFIFASSQPIPRLPSFYLNHLELLERFGHHFLESTQTIRENAMADAVNLPEIITPGRFRDHGLDELLVSHEAKSKFLYETGTDQLLIKAASRLTERERQVLMQSIDGRTAKEVSGTLGLSRRTVETYLERSKSKLGMLSKHELLKEAKTLKLLGILQ